MKQVSQLDQDGYFVGLTTADLSPLEPGVYLIPGGAIDQPAPVVPEGKMAKWNGQWLFEDIPQPEPEPEPEPLTPEQQEEVARSKRQAAFSAEADPLFFKWQAGEGIEAEWLAKRDEIRARFPYSEPNP